jgi:hypothetical protein
MFAFRSLPTCAAVVVLAFGTTAFAADDLPLFRDEPWLQPATSQHVAPQLRLVQAEDEPTGILFFWNSDAKPEGGTPGPDDPLVSDRPDFTEASCTVGAGVIQLETGYTYFYDDDRVTRLEAHSFPEALFRIGVWEDWLELRFGVSYGSESETVGGVSNTASGSQDLYVGAKIGLTPQQGWFPEMAIIPQMRVPVGGPLASDHLLPGVNWLYGWDMHNSIFSFGGSTQFNLAIDDGTGSDYVEFAQSLTIGYTLGEKLGAYTEWFVLTPIGADTARTEHYLDGGLTYSVSNDVQLDVRIGKGVSSASADLFTGIGAVFRF